EEMRKPGAFGAFKFLWKLKLEHDPNVATTLTEPILLDRLIGFRGFKSIAFVATASETVHAIDVDFGTPLWKYHVNYSASPPPLLAGTPACPGGLSAALSRPTTVAPFAFAAGGGGRAGRSGGGGGEPGRGATTIPAAGRGRGGAPPPAVPPAPSPAVVPGSAAAAANLAPGGLPGGARQGGPGGAGVPVVPGADAAYVVGSDGYLHALNVSNRCDHQNPALVPSREHARDGTDHRERRGDGVRGHDARLRQPARCGVGDGSREPEEDRRRVQSRRGDDRGNVRGRSRSRRHRVCGDNGWSDCDVERGLRAGTSDAQAEGVVRGCEGRFPVVAAVVSVEGPGRAHRRRTHGAGRVRCRVSPGRPGRRRVVRGSDLGVGGCARELGGC